MQATRGVEEHKVVAVLTGMLDGSLGDIDGVGRAHLEHGNVKLLADRFELLYCSGAINIAGCQQRTLALLAHIRRELCAVSRLARALKTDEHDYARGL